MDDDDNDDVFILTTGKMENADHLRNPKTSLLTQSL
jgi:hypothetical protein